MSRAGRRYRLREAEIVLAGGTVGYWIRHTTRRRHVHIVIDDERGLEVRVPWRFAHAEVERMLRRHEAWVLARVGAWHERRRRRTPLFPGAVLPLMDESLCLEVAAGLRPRARREGGRLVVHHPTGEAEGLAGVVEGWYRNEARAVLTGRLDELAPELGDLRPSRIQIRGQRTRWGSCSTRGTISLNWRLLMLPRELVDYVLVHELCHLRHMDHSRRFWNLVATLVPDYPERRDRLHAHPDAFPI